MLFIKHIPAYIIRNFLRTFSITFFVSIFVLMMQFLFQHVDDLVGKGVGVSVLLQFFWYSALSLVPLSLPLSILLGSLMTFGNLGERLELLSMKAAGISLFRIMRPLIILMVFISLASFYFADRILPETQVRMWTLLFSMREKSPELDIPEGTFYNGIEDRNIYVGRKHKGKLYNLVIYDYSEGFTNTSIILADTGVIQMSSDKTYLMLSLYSGESFSNMQQEQSSTSDKSIIPYRRETFSRKNLIIDFDANFNVMSSQFLEGQYVSKTTSELEYTTDSLTRILNSLRSGFRAQSLMNYYKGKTTQEAITVDPKLPHADNLQALFQQQSSMERIVLIDYATARINTLSGDIRSNIAQKEWRTSEFRKHSIEWHRRYTLPFACLIFLFIGAPLGAIIRKGGMGMPIVISTVLFIVYYIIDNTGYKMAREGIWPIAAGMWLSAAILLPFGVWLTYMAATDSTFMSADTYKLAFKKIFSKENPIFAKLKRITNKH